MLIEQWVYRRPSPFLAGLDWFPLLTERDREPGYAGKSLYLTHTDSVVYLVVTGGQALSCVFMHIWIVVSFLIVMYALWPDELTLCFTHWFAGRKHHVRHSHNGSLVE